MSAPAAPYPADTLSKGWRFEIHMEKVKKSDTWLRARSGEMRGALMLLWGEAWEQSPCGSLPNDDELVALIIDMPLAKFKKNRDLLMRGWSLASDGRLYHETITDRVLAMMDKRANDAKRAANRRAREADSAATDALVTGASRVTSAESTVSSTPSTKHQNQAPSTLHPAPAGELHSPKPPMPSAGVADAPAVPPKPKAAKPAKEPAPTSDAWDSYATAYRERYGELPVRNAKVNGQLAQLIARLGADEAPGVARFYVGHQNAMYVRAMHPVDLLLRDAEGLRTSWATGRQVTSAQAVQADRTQTNANAFGPLLAAARQREAEHG